MKKFVIFFTIALLAVVLVWTIVQLIGLAIGS